MLDFFKLRVNVELTKNNCVSRKLRESWLTWKEISFISKTSVLASKFA